MPLHAVARAILEKSPAAGAASPRDASPAPPGQGLPAAAEALTKYIPTEVVGIVTGAYALVIPVVREDPDLRMRALASVAVLGYVAMALVLAIQVVLEARKASPGASLLSIGFSGPAAGEFLLCSACYAAWVVSLMAGFLDQPMPVVAGVATILFIHLIEPIRKIL